MSAEIESNHYHINLQIFEGPLDLLLHLIKKNELDITNIPILTIMQQYLEYIDLMKELDIDLAGEFILMAAELAHIKSKMLVQKDNEEDDDDENDPRADLTKKLLEYQRYKEVSEWLSTQPRLGVDVFKRTNIKKPPEIKENTDQIIEIDPFSLLSAFQEILKNVVKDEKQHEVIADRASVSERIYEILENLDTDHTVLFTDLFQNHKTKIQVVVSFLAILEMAKLKMIQIFQLDSLGVIRIKKVMSDFNPDEITV